ncbi:hypothetical protein [Hippea maritima]|uniref:Glycerophosphoryl diester phosphodiesterase membrane domain-containing protein n=1 Tax=Hippea maritima (strain ATCC 700847 / DSM 10411 / MH2) TaxID=760142 RepID=F2LVE0_HIPMA|nr:hypothetical protein [Hippea maritima]AEA33724.1 hypothetical protein Hipma_0754 [Hippea maritima DSM 10411]
MWELITKSFDFMFKKPVFFVPALFPALVSLILGLLGLGMMYSHSNVSSSIGAIILLIGVAITLIAVLLANSVVIHMTYEMESYKRVNLSESFNVSMGKLGVIFLVSTIVGLASAIGLMLLVIPGIIVILFTVFSLQEVVLLNKDVKESIIESYEIVKENFGSVLVFLLILMLIELPLGFVLGLIPVIGSAIASLILGTLSPIAITLLYIQLRGEQL